jgi:hypothetical protein
MRFRSMRERRAEVLGDPHLQALLAGDPDLVCVVDAYLWSYPRSPARSRRSLLVVGVAGFGLVVALIGVWRVCRSESPTSRH